MKVTQFNEIKKSRDIFRFYLSGFLTQPTIQPLKNKREILTCAFELSPQLIRAEVTVLRAIA